MHDQYVNRDDPTMPRVYEGALDNVRLRQLLADLADCAEILHVQVRGTRGQRVPERTCLAEIHSLLESGAAHSAQIRYRHDEALWCDTLLPRDGNFRLIRTELNQDAHPGKEQSCE